MRAFRGCARSLTLFPTPFSRSRACIPRIAVNLTRLTVALLACVDQVSPRTGQSRALYPEWRFLPVAASSNFPHIFLSVFAIEIRSYIAQRSRTAFGKIPTSPFWANFPCKHQTRQSRCPLGTIICVVTLVSPPSTLVDCIPGMKVRCMVQKRTGCRALFSARRQSTRRRRKYVHPSDHDRDALDVRNL
ncbi:hypothetical protein C8Q74DRAFT_257292 [Fomes fomentarius]|nr:hypothetical protein C8Q74DRAFT_257292 [Fomes fomentarius]